MITFHETTVGVSQKLSFPPMYKVILLNDDFTPMDFVILILKEIFHKKSLDAEELMLRIHHEGAAVCGIYSHEIAETKLNQVHEKARLHKHPLRGTLERESC